MKQKLINGDCIEELKKLPDNSVDSIVTDPPYHLSTVKRFSKKDSGDNWNVKSGVFHRGSKGFMGKEWDGGDIAFKPEVWYECLRVLKPGGHILSFGGTRTYHRMAVAIEDAGFEIRDCIFWVYGSGFPKSHNIGKAIDKKQGNKRKVIGEKKHAPKFNTKQKANFNNTGYNKRIGEDGRPSTFTIDKGNSEWEGWGTALKPAVEPVVLGRKPLSEKTIVDNVLKHGTGGLNIDESRVGADGGTTRSHQAPTGESGWRVGHDVVKLNEGRFPANLILECICEDVVNNENKNKPYKYNKNYKEDGFLPNVNAEAPYNYNDTKSGNIHTNPDCPCFVLDKQSGELISGYTASHHKQSGRKKDGVIFNDDKFKTLPSNAQKLDKGGASRFFKEIPLKPEVEPVVLGRKPLSEKTIAENVLKHGTGGLNIDESRVGNEERTYDLTMTSGNFETTGGGKNKKQGKVTTTGRFPANLILECICDEVVEGKQGEMIQGSYRKKSPKSLFDFKSKEGANQNAPDDYRDTGNIHTNPDCPCFVLDEQSGEVGNGHWSKTKTKGYGDFGGGSSSYEGVGVKDKSKGGASRYFKEIEGDRIFYTAKASKSERNNGLEGFEEAPIKGRDAGQDKMSNPYKLRPNASQIYAANQTTSKIGANPNKPTQPRANNHPTVKPVKLMRYLIKLITPPNGTVLDPFMGSGTTGVAAKLEGFNFVGIEKEEEYIKIAEARIKNYKENPKKKTKPKKKKVKKVKSKFWK